MSDHMIQLLTSGLAAIGGLMAWVNGRANKKRIEDVKNQVHEVHILFNSRFTEMLAMAKAASHAEGITEGVASEQARVAEVHTAGSVTVQGSPVIVTETRNPPAIDER